MAPEKVGNFVDRNRIVVSERRRLHGRLTSRASRRTRAGRRRALGGVLWLKTFKSTRPMSLRKALMVAAPCLSPGRVRPRHEVTARTDPSRDLLGHVLRLAKARVPLQIVGPTWSWICTSAM